MAKLVVGFDGSSTLAPRTGVGRAALGLLRALVALEASDVEWRVLLNSFSRRMGPEHGFLESGGTRVFRSRYFGGRMVRKWARGDGPGVEPLVGIGVQVWHAVASYMPPARDARRIATVHDLTFLDESNRERASLGGALFAETFPRLLPECAAVITPTEAVRERVMETYRLAPDAVAAIPWGVDREMFRIENERLVEISRHDLAIPSDSYLLAVSDHEPRKRAGLLLDVYARLREVEKATPPLVVLGWAGKPPKALKERPGLHRHVHVLPRVADGLLAGLYTGAAATILTSRDEGFGFPMLEAQACGSPVVATACAAWREVSGGSAALIENADVEQWAESVRAVAFDQAGRDRAKAAGLKNVERFSWEICARRHLLIYRKVAEGKKG